LAIVTDVHRGFFQNIGGYWEQVTNISFQILIHLSFDAVELSQDSFTTKLWISQPTQVLIDRKMSPTPGNGQM